MTERFAVGIGGTRDYYPDDAVLASIRRLKVKHLEEGLVIVTGDARGVDEIAAGWAKTEGLPYVVEKADWATKGARAGHERNGRVIARSKVFLAFLHPKPLVGLPDTSPGTCDAIEQARRANIPVHAHHDGRWLTDSQLQRIAEQVVQRRLRPSKGRA